MECGGISEVELIALSEQFVVLEREGAFSLEYDSEFSVWVTGPIVIPLPHKGFLSVPAKPCSCLNAQFMLSHEECFSFFLG